VCAVLSWRLAVGPGPPGGSGIIEGSRGLMRLAAEVFCQSVAVAREI